MATPSDAVAALTPEERGAALEFLRQLAVEVSQGTVDLPCFPNVVVRVSEALMNPDTTPERVAAGRASDLRNQRSWMELLDGWQASIGGTRKLGIRG